MQAVMELQESIIQQLFNLGLLTEECEDDTAWDFDMVMLRERISNCAEGTESDYWTDGEEGYGSDSEDYWTTVRRRIVKRNNAVFSGHEDQVSEVEKLPNLWIIGE